MLDAGLKTLSFILCALVISLPINTSAQQASDQQAPKGSVGSLVELDAIIASIKAEFLGENSPILVAAVQIDDINCNYDRGRIVDLYLDLFARFNSIDAEMTKAQAYEQALHEQSMQPDSDAKVCSDKATDLHKNWMQRLKSLDLKSVLQDGRIAATCAPIVQQALTTRMQATSNQSTVLRIQRRIKDMQTIRGSGLKIASKTAWLLEKRDLLNLALKTAIADCEFAD